MIDVPDLRGEFVPVSDQANPGRSRAVGRLAVAGRLATVAGLHHGVPGAAQLQVTQRGYTGPILQAR